MGAKQRRAFMAQRYSLGQRRCPVCCCQLVFNPQMSGLPPQRNKATADHIVPRSQGGKDNVENLLMMCHLCNSERGNTDLLTFVTRKGAPNLLWFKLKLEVAVRCYNAV